MMGSECWEGDRLVYRRYRNCHMKLKLPFCCCATRKYELYSAIRQTWLWRVCKTSLPAVHRYCPYQDKTKVFRKCRMLFWKSRATRCVNCEERKMLQNVFSYIGYIFMCVSSSNIFLEVKKYFMTMKVDWHGGEFARCRGKQFWRVLSFLIIFFIFSRPWEFLLICKLICIKHLCMSQQ